MPPLKPKTSRTKLNKSKPSELNCSEVSFPKSDLKLDIKATFDKESNQMSYIFNIKNIDEADTKDVEQKVFLNIEILQF